MFQFRAFPPYTYLIQCTVLEYCSSGFPHSEISGSTDICSSPKLIAACHVLHRLLMPRHSPCALYSLTCRRCGLRIARRPFRDVSLTPSHLLFDPQTLSLVCVSSSQCSAVHHSTKVRDTLVLLNYAGNLQILCKIDCYPHLFRCSTINSHNFSFQLLMLKGLLLPCFFITFSLFSFQGTTLRSLLKPDLKTQSLVS